MPGPGERHMDVKTGKEGNVKTVRRRDVNMNLRVTREEKREMERCASILGMTQTELILNGVGIISGMIEKHRKGQRERRRDKDGKGEADTL